ncbi:ATP-binding protein [Streptomyces flavofungini]|uniref:ATP-binding protein n=1 Tax=Streptomyces flavofungini TaxID=68200 RepID=UPI0025B12D6C|nr:ATP-binding protein [Streptomyces flavofungini]WJV44307.1 ATP-binding protein [Streptomyces flavofungini]
MTHSSDVTAREAARAVMASCPLCDRTTLQGAWRPTAGDGPALLTVDADGCGIGAARRAARAYAAVRCPAVDAADVALVVSELCTNSFRHATGWWRLRLHGHRDGLIADIDDASEQLPVPRLPDTRDGTGGMGMLLVAMLTTTLDVYAYSGGKTVRVTWKAPRG